MIPSAIVFSVFMHTSSACTPLLDDVDKVNTPDGAIGREGSLV